MDDVRPGPHDDAVSREARRLVIQAQNLMCDAADLLAEAGPAFWLEHRSACGKTETLDWLADRIEYRRDLSPALRLVGAEDHPLPAAG